MRHPRPIRRRLVESAAIFAVAASAAGLEWVYGRRGFMPIDHSVVFDGGWRTLSGQVPFRDYVTPNALTPSFIQAGFFAVLGVNWLAYVLHAAIANALFAMLVYVLLRLCRAGPAAAALYAVLAGVAFYPPIGVPFHDQTAFFFGVGAVTCAVAARRHGLLERALWFVAPFCLLFAALSKQTPALLIAPVVLVLALGFNRHWRRGLAWLSIGASCAIGLLLGSAAAIGVEWDLVRVFFLELPLATGRQRGTSPSGAAFVFLLLAIGLLALVLAPAVISSLARRRPLRLRPGVGLPLFLSVSLLVVCALFVRLTLNEPSEGVALLFPSLGLFQVAASRAVPPRIDPIRAPLPILVAAGTSLLVILLAVPFNQTVNAKRSANDMVFSGQALSSGLPSRLSPLRWQVPAKYSGLTSETLGSVITYVGAQEGNFVLIGDTTILYGLTRRPSVFPSLFLVRGLTVPGPKSDHQARFERLLERNIERYDVRRIVIERRTWDGVGLASLPSLLELVRRCGAPPAIRGYFEVIELLEEERCRGDA